MARKTDLSLGLLDRLILFGSILVVIGSIFILMQDRYLRQLAGFSEGNGSEPVGEVLSTAQDVRRRIGSTMAWFPIINEDPLFENDSLFTGENSEAKIQLKEGLLLELSSNSLVTLRRSNQNTYLDLQLGQVLAKVQKGSTLKLREGDSVGIIKTTQDQTVVKLQRSKSGKITVATTDAPIEMHFKNKGQKIGLNNVLELENNGKELKLLDYSSILRSPILAKKIWIESGEQVSFLWNRSIETKKPQKIQISRDPSFNRMQIDQELPADQVTYSAHELKEEGTYFWRLQEQKNTATEKENWEDSSRSGEFVLLKKEPLETIYPFQGLNIVTLGQPADIKFIWKGKRGIENYLWQIARDKEFKNILREKTTPLTFLIENEIPVGEYYWRVKAAEKSSPIAHLWSDIVQFGVDKKIVSESDEKLLSPPVSLSEPVIPENVPAPSLEAKPEVLKKAALQSLDPPLIAKGKKTVVLNFPPESLRTPNTVKDPLTPTNSPRFQWKPVEGAEKYLIEIAADKKFQNKKQSMVTRRPQYVWKKVEPGNYYWRVKGLNEEKQSLLSSVGQIEVMLPPPSHISSEKLVQKVDSPEDKKSLNKKYMWKWAPVPQAKSYEVLMSAHPQFDEEVEVLNVKDSYVEKEIQPNRPTYLKVASVGGDQNKVGPFSVPGQVTLENQFVLEPPLISLPENGLTIISFGNVSNPVAFSWMAVKHAIEYRVQFSKDAQFKQLIAEKKTKNIDFVINSKEFLGHCFWRVRSENGDVFSPWSVPRQFLVRKQ